MEYDKEPRQIAQTEYHAYLLRFWRESPGGSWRALLQDAATGERHGFAGLVDLLRFLWAQSEASPSPASESAFPAPDDQEEAEAG